MLNFNENNEVIEKTQHRVILVGLELREDISYSMEELAGLAEASDTEVIGIVTQSLDRPDKATFIGKGKVDEIGEMASNMGADTVIFNDELSGVQLRNLEERLGISVIDRTILILDIFAARAKSREGKLQVELAQLQYRMPRLTGFGKSLSKQGGGIGTRGPGEKKLETDKRHIRKRMDDIKAELEKVTKNRSTQRSKREKANIPVAALVGYTNAGKSAIMNRILALTEKEEKSVGEKDMLFATLDTSQRSIRLENGREFILVDTVGFVSKLPHALVDAFKATLEEAVNADILVHVVDSSYDNYDFQIDVTDSVLREIGAGDREKIMVYNKIDVAIDRPVDASGFDAVFMSAKTGENAELLVRAITDKIFQDRISARLIIPYDRGDIVSYLCSKCKVNGTEYAEEGTIIDVELEKSDYDRLKKYDKI